MGKTRSWGRMFGIFGKSFMELSELDCCGGCDGCEAWCWPCWEWLPTGVLLVDRSDAILMVMFRSPGHSHDFFRLGPCPGMPLSCHTRREGIDVYDSLI